MFDRVIVGGDVLDGSGADAFRADVGVRGDRIAAIGDLSEAEAVERIDASGLIVCPGFIDVHSHSDTYLLIEPAAESKIRQGVTTEVVGNCGASAAPLAGEYKLPSDWRDKTYPGSWSTVAEYRERLDTASPALNVVLLIGHNTLRAGAMGYENRAPTETESERMAARLDQALEEGAKGLSSGLAYPPGIFAKTAEIVELARVAAKHGALYTTHMRSEGGQLLESIAEALIIGRDAGIRVQISHLKAGGQNNWHKMDRAIEMIHEARAAGVEVASDRYPYTAGCTDLDIVFPDWAEEGGREAVLRRLRDPETRQRLREDLLASRPLDAWSHIIIGSTTHPDNLGFRGMPLVDVAEKLGLDAVDTVIYLTDTDDLKTSAFFAGMSEENMHKVLAQPFVMIGSDASLRRPEGPLSEDYPHPRAYGTFPRFLRWSLDGKTVPLPEAIRKMTSMPAAQFKLKDRGLIRSNMMADVIAFDSHTVVDRSHYGDPHQYPKGIRHVLVNGILTLHEDKLTGKRTGRFLSGT